MVALASDATTYTWVGQIAGWAIQAHLQMTRVSSLDEAQKITDRVLQRHLSDAPSPESLIQLFREAEREFDSGT